MRPPFHELCEASGSVTALLGSPMRLYKFGNASQATSKPYAVWQSVGGAPENLLAGRPQADAYSIQVDVYSTTSKQAENIAEAIRDAIELDAYVVGWYGTTFEASTKTYRFTFGVDFLTDR